MKREVSTFFRFSVCILAVLTLLSASTHPTTATPSIDTLESVVLNGGFENGTYEPWVPVLASSQTFEILTPSVASRHIRVSDEQAHTGNYSLKIFDLKGDIRDLPYFGVSLKIPAAFIESVGYRLSLWVSTGDFNDTTVPGPEGLQWMLGVGIYSVSEEDQPIFFDSWNPSYPATNVLDQMYWVNEWKNIIVDIPGDTALIIIGVDWKMAELVPSDAKIYIDDVDLTPYTVSVSTDKSQYYFGDVTILASISNYEEDPLNVTVEGSILMPNDFLVGPLTMEEKSPGVYSVSWPVPMRFSLSGLYDVTVRVRARARSWPDGEIYESELSLLTSFATLPIVPFAISLVLVGTIIVAIMKSKWMEFEIFVLLVLLFILLLY